MASLRLSAEGLAGPPYPEKGARSGGREGTRNDLPARTEAANREYAAVPEGEELGKDGELPIPAYEAMQGEGRRGVYFYRLP